MAAIDASANIRDFFQAQLSEALSAQGVQTADATRDYLVELMAGFANGPLVARLGFPLVTLLERALAVAGREREARLRELGDTSLFLYGFLPDSFERRGLTAEYVETMGGRAYRAVVRVRGGGVFAELASRFREMGGVLDEVRERTSLRTDGELLRLYQRWLESGSDSLARRLARRGVHPVPPSRGEIN
ncbi:MAG: hypothetical protein OEZ06_05685 [Myxococcales bacterium]|nr:hypothetical protein [Myxococcales bacterium]